MTDTLVIRSARPADADALAALAALDSSRVPAGDVLLAEAAGHVIAAIGVPAGEVIADPFLPTAHTVDVLRVRREQIRAPRRTAGHAGRRLRLRVASG